MMMERNAGKTRIAFGKTLQEIFDSSKSQQAEGNIVSVKKGVLDAILACMMRSFQEPTKE